MDSSNAIDENILLFFNKRPGALPIYERLLKMLTEQAGPFEVQVKATQISFFRRRMFACVSFNRVRPGIKGDFLTVTFGLGQRLSSPRLTATEPYPGRWTHHAVITGPGGIDGELLDWLVQAVEFAEGKR
ncbi:MAG: hypothetical protein HFE91_08260 [Acutalibacter sp.]|uniref:DUF5655 domain-containing protein n=1 Tax=Acutalibacter sp. TaxID=1918636 RepID=UPI0021724FF1|nr:DUF5655 domain-containing protein [Acutalibacter sp.]MCI9225448.1 hypothetical protein [Acutalibacter sp.]